MLASVLSQNATNMAVVLHMTDQKGAFHEHAQCQEKGLICTERLGTICALDLSRLVTAADVYVDQGLKNVSRSRKRVKNSFCAVS